MPHRRFWTKYSDEKLLQVPLKDLGVSVERTWLARCVKDLYGEIEERGLRIRPRVWISDEWFSPAGTPGIAIPFYLAHPRLMRLERKKILEVEGGTVPECMRILRHEAGHVVQHAYRLHRRRSWQKHFGHSSEKYPEYYRPNPASKRYVQHLRLWYAQSHPDEDFAETFAIWLTPRSAWRKRYAGWPALNKLEYVDELMAEIANQPPILKRGPMVDPISRLNWTLEEYYKKKVALYATEAPTTYDKDLLRIFSSDPRHSDSPAASAFIRRHRKRLRQDVADWTGEYQLALDSIIDDIIARCRELKLRAVGSERRLLADFTILFTAHVVHSIYNPNRRMWLAV
ncbi:MAG: hypothetical protein EPO08_09995 [Rhodospirillaceae bacterium]|nr:MAG: hypothetical protein EPO08_09995 [Rhodospirillaceae bacterium]